MISQKRLFSPALFSWKRYVLATLTIVGGFTFSSLTQAATGINDQISFQGKVVNTNGTNVANGNYDFVFKLYTVSSGGTAIWTETWNTGTAQVTVTDGIFQANLGTFTDLPGSVDFNTDNIYLGIEFNADGEMTPRIHFTAAPYAFNALKVAGLTVTDTTGTFTLTNAKTLTVNNTLTFAGTDATTITFQGTDTYVGRTTTDTLTNKTIGSTGLVFSGATTDIDTAVGEGLALQGRAASTFTTTSGGLTFQAAGSGTTATVQIGAGGTGSTTPDFFGLDVKSDTGDPAGGFEGAMYYNTVDNKFRCYQGSAWTDCIGSGGGGVSDGDKGDVTVSGSGATWNVDFTSTDGSGSTSSASGLETGTGGVGLLQGCADNQVLKWNESSSIWECASDRGSYHNVLGGNYTNNSTTFTDADDDATGNDDLGFPVGANEEWVFDVWVNYSSPTAADSKWQVTAPTGASCDVTYSDIEGAVAVANVNCATSSGTIATTAAADNMLINGYVSTATTSGNVQLQFGQAAASGTSTIYSGSNVRAYKVSGADVAEVYYSKNETLLPGTVVSMNPTLESGVKKSTQPYEQSLVGIVSTRPGLVIGDAPKGEGTPVYIALVGRVPVRVNEENGKVQAGDYLTSSSTPGEAMRATRAGSIIGQALEDMPKGTPTGLVKAFIKNGFSPGPSFVEGQKQAAEDIGLIGSLLGEPAFLAADDPSETVPAHMGEQPSLSIDMIHSLSQDGLVVELNQTEALALQTEAGKLVTFEGSGVSTFFGRIVAKASFLAEELAEFKGKTIFGDLVTFVEEVVFRKAVFFEKVPTFNKDTGGFALIKEGERFVDVTFETEFQHQPVVAVSLTNDRNPLFANGEKKDTYEDAEVVEEDFLKTYFTSDIQYLITQKSVEGFRIVLNEEAPQDLSFSWIALAVNDPVVSVTSDKTNDEEADESNDVFDEEVLEPAIIPDDGTNVTATMTEETTGNAKESTTLEEEKIVETEQPVEADGF